VGVTSWLVGLRKSVEYSVGIGQKGKGQKEKGKRLVQDSFASTLWRHVSCGFAAGCAAGLAPPKAENLPIGLCPWCGLCPIPFAPYFRQ